MAMRLDVEFQRPLRGGERSSFLLVIAALAKSRSVRWIDGGHVAVVLGEAMGRERVAELLRAEDLPLMEIRSSLNEDEDDEADDHDGDGGALNERLRPIGR